MANTPEPASVALLGAGFTGRCDFGSAPKKYREVIRHSPQGYHEHEWEALRNYAVAGARRFTRPPGSTISASVAVRF